MTSPALGSVAAGIASAVIAVGIAALLARADRPPDRARVEDLPMSHTACSPLLSVSEAIDAGDRERLRLAIAAAKEMARAARSNENILFGLPEEVAMEIASENEKRILSDEGIRQRVERRLQEAQEECE